MRNFILVLFISFTSITLHAQDCYSDYRDQGNEAYEKLQFQQAINLLDAAKICPEITPEQVEEVEELLTRTRNGYIDAIVKARDDAIQSEQNAIKSQEEANKQAQYSEANRLAYLATQELSKDNLDDALPLAYRALKLVEEDPLPLVEESFGNMVGRLYANQLEGHDGAIRQIQFVGNDSNVLTISDDQKVRLWGPDGNELASLDKHMAPIVCHSVSPNAQVIVTGDQHGGIHIWDDKGNSVAAIDPVGDKITALSFASDGNSFLSTDRSGQAYIWSNSGTLINNFKSSTVPIWDAYYSQTGSYIVMRLATGTVFIFDGQGQEVSQYESGNHSYSAVLSEDEKQLLTASSDGSATLWTISNGTNIKINHSEPVYIAQFVPQSGNILTVSMDHKIRLWDPSGRLIKEAIAQKGRINHIDFTEDGQRIVSSSSDGTVRIWDYQLTMVVDLDDHDSEVLSAQFSPDGDMILTASRDHTARLWSHDGIPLMTTASFTGPVRQAWFSADGSHIIACSDDHTAAIIRNPKNVFAELQRNPPQVTEEQAARYGLK